ncbi:MAG: class I SAM-dependent methyltransferase [Ignavibacteria bacterium]
MHPQQAFFVSSVKQNLPDWFKGKSVLEVGSLDINGSVRPLFEECTYLGIDVGAGRSVDVVCRGEDLGVPAASYDFVISCEMMEHNPRWRETFINMLRVMKPDGLMLLTCATFGRRKHGTPDSTPVDSPLTSAEGANYYRNLGESDFTGLIAFDAWFAAWRFFVDPTSYDLYFLGLGRDAAKPQCDRAGALFSAFDDYYRRKSVNGVY